MQQLITQLAAANWPVLIIRANEIIEDFHSVSQLFKLIEKKKRSVFAYYEIFPLELSVKIKVSVVEFCVGARYNQLSSSMWMAAHEELSSGGGGGGSGWAATKWD